MYSEPEAAADDDVSDSNTDSDYESTFDECSFDEEVKDHEPPNKPVFVNDKNDPPMAVGTIYENINVLRFAVAQHSIKHGFEYNIVKSDPGRFMIHCPIRKDGKFMSRSFVVIDRHTVNEKIRFRRLFFALKPCVDGFLKGCRPYLAIDNTFLTGKFKGQLAAAIVVDAHNWMYPVAFGVMDSETNENWSWFMEKLRAAIGTPPSLTICTDAG
jgi:hypothetical protein